jgi:hypothetical protein
MEKSAFFAMAVGPAQASQKATGVPASVTLAQAILESHWGDSHMGDAWNYFGIKATEGQPFVVQHTAEYDKNHNKYFIDANFRRFRSMEDCFRAHGEFLRDNPRYGPAFQTHDAESFARAIAAAGYATAPTYADQLIELIHENNLTQYDTGGAAKPTGGAAKPAGGAPAPPKQLDMLTIQKTLEKHGFDPGIPDGEWGPNTQRAVRAFQQAHGLEVDGVIGPNTMRALVKAAAG